MSVRLGALLICTRSGSSSSLLSKTRPSIGFWIDALSLATRQCHVLRPYNCTMGDLSITSTFPLNDGNGMPVLAFGTVGVTTDLVSTALRHQYVHIDTAQVYGSEKDVGTAIKDSGIPRSSMFICSKLWNPDFSRDGALQGVKRSLKDLQVDYVDLFLLHNPVGGASRRLEAWLGLQDAVEAGLVRSIGVSNWSIKHLEQLTKGRRIQDPSRMQSTRVSSLESTERHCKVLQRQRHSNHCIFCIGAGPADGR